MTPRRLSIVMSILACMAAAVWGGCGGAGAHSPPPRLSAGLADRANAICARWRLRGLGYKPVAGAGRKERDAVAAGIRDSLLPAIQEAIDELRSIRAPRAEKPRVEALAGALQAAVNSAQHLRAPTFEALDGLLARESRMAVAAGLRSCAYA